VAAGAPVGIPDLGRTLDSPPQIAAVLSKKTEAGAPVYSSSIRALTDTAQGSVLIRNLLLAQTDGSAAMVLAGPATNLAQLLGLYGSRPQIVAKVKHLVVAIGAFSGGAVDADIKADIASARKLFAEWPTPLIGVGAEVGEALPYPGSSIENSFAWAPNHPVADAYRTFRTMPYNAPASALAAMLYAVSPDDGYFKLSEPGTITVLDDGRTQFAPSAAGRHRCLIADPSQRERVLKAYTELVPAPPRVAPARGRGGRGAPPPAQQPQAPPPDETKPSVQF
jgi:hypothetical protein